MTGRIPMMIETLSGMLGAISGKSGRRPVGGLGVAAAEPARQPDGRRNVPGFAASGWTALVATPGTSDEIKNKISKDLRTIVTNPDVSKKYAELGSFTRAMTPQEARPTYPPRAGAVETDRAIRSASRSNRPAAANNYSLCAGSTRASRLARHCAHLIGMAGSSPAMTNEWATNCRRRTSLRATGRRIHRIAASSIWHRPGRFPRPASC